MSVDAYRGLSRKRETFIEKAESENEEWKKEWKCKKKTIAYTPHFPVNKLNLKQIEGIELATGRKVREEILKLRYTAKETVPFNVIDLDEGIIKK